MKKQLTVALGLAVLATPAFATKARLQALGEDIYGSFYINDNRNIWLNAAQINNHKDLVTFEWGNTVNAQDTQDIQATGNTRGPRSEGGVYRTSGNLTYGVHFGSASNTSNAMRGGVGVAMNEENNVDVFVGGDAGVKWGANLGYSQSAADESASKEKQNALRTRLGVIMGDTQAYANINLANNAKDAGGDKFEGKLGYQVGAIHAWEGNTLFADYRSFDAEGKTAAGVKNDIGLSQLQVGIGRVTRLNDKSNLFTRVSYLSAEVDNEAGSTSFGTAFGTCNEKYATLCRNYKTGRVPVVVGLETEATSWLTLRASVGQVVWGEEENKGTTRPIQNSTLVNAGATLKFGELSVDGVIGNNDGTNTTATNTNSDSTAGSAGALRTDVLMTRVGMTYRF